MNTPQFVEPFTCWQVFGLFSDFGYYEQNSFEYLCTSLVLNTCLVSIFLVFLSKYIE